MLSSYWTFGVHAREFKGNIPFPASFSLFFILSSAVLDINSEVLLVTKNCILLLCTEGYVVQQN